MAAKQRPHFFDQHRSVVGLTEEAPSFRQIFFSHPHLAGCQDQLDWRPAVSNNVSEPQAVHASGHVDVSKYDPDVFSGFQQDNSLICAASLERVETCFLQKGYCIQTDQELIFDNKNEGKP